MVLDLFDSLLKELGKALEIEDLHLDDTKTCLVKFPNGLEVYIEPYEKGEDMLIMCQLGQVPPGRYREDMFREALKANGMYYPRYGTFAYSDQSDRLVLFDLLPLTDLTGDKIATFLVPFMEKAFTWKETIEKGEVPVFTTTTAATSPMGLFGGLR